MGRETERKVERIYISGQISGLTYEEARERFKRTEKWLRHKYPSAKVCNPMRSMLPRGAKWQHHMLIDLWNLSRCTHIYMMQGWHNSHGARIENEWSKKLRITRIDNNGEI